MKHGFTLLLLLSLSGCAATKPREISGRLVQSKTLIPVADQNLVLDRPPGNYPGFSMFILGVPQQVTIAATTTDKNGYFAFTTIKDRKRYLTILLSDPLPKKYMGYSAIQLQDSSDKKATEVIFDSHLIHKKDGGFAQIQ